MFGSLLNEKTQTLKTENEGKRQKEIDRGRENVPIYKGKQMKGIFGTASGLTCLAKMTKCLCIHWIVVLHSCNNAHLVSIGTQTDREKMISENLFV